MKTITRLLGLIIGCSLFAFNSIGRNDVPQKVKDAFAKKFPTVKKVDWEKESENEWEGEFKMNKIEYSANFSSDGTWLETEHEIDIKDVPENVMKTLKAEFSEYEIEEAEISETPKGSFYEFAIEKGETEMEVVLNSNGEILKSEKEENDD
jgi:uncharacterized membrane protein YkoI